MATATIHCRTSRAALQACTDDDLETMLECKPDWYGNDDGLWSVREDMPSAAAAAGAAALGRMHEHKSHVENAPLSRAVARRHRRL